MPGKILRETSFGETRAIAITEDGRAIRHFISRLSDADLFAPLASRHVAQVTRIAPDQGAIYLTLANGLGAVARPDPNVHLHEGQSVDVDITAEAHGSKLARIRVATGDVPPLSGFELWASALPGDETWPIEDTPITDRAVSDAFDDAARPTATLPGGGRLQITPTPALTAIDIDTAGRRATGTAASRALKTNRAAVAEIARQIALRAIGGLVVTDCIAPLNRDAASKVKDAFVEAFHAIDRRQMTCLAPSRLGLMETSIARRYAPISSRLKDPNGDDTPETRLMDALRLLQREASANRVDCLQLSLPEPVHARYLANAAALSAAIDAALGPRIEITCTPEPDARVSIL